MLDLIKQPWPWYVAGPIIAFVMALMLFFGKRFGLSSNLRTMCSILGAGRNCEFFDFNWKDQLWNLVFAAGLLIGGALARYLLTPDVSVVLSEATVSELRGFGIEHPGQDIVPISIFSWNSLGTLKGFVMLVVGGFLVGFGTRYAGGCTSGHAISGLSDLQLPSLIAVIGFFIGGMTVTNFVLPYLLAL